MPDAYLSPAEQRRYTRAYPDATSQTIVADVQQRPDVTGEGRLYVELTVEAFEQILDLAGFTRSDT